MADQLSLRFDPPLPDPGPVAPMWPVRAADPFDSDAWLFEPWWGGHRALAFVGPAARPGTGETRLLDADGRDLVPVLPELAGLAVRVAARSAVLDGELVVVDGQGRADPDGLRDRLAGAPGRPIAFLVFDLLHLDGQWLLNRPLERRRALLDRVLRPGDEVVVVPAIVGEGRALHAAVAAQGIAGILARRRTSPYLPGVRSGLWRAIPASPAAHPDTAGSEAAGGSATASGAPGSSGAPGEPTGVAPVLALFRRLPLEDPAEPPPDRRSPGDRPAPDPHGRRDGGS